MVGGLSKKKNKGKNSWTDNSVMLAMEEGEVEASIEGINGGGWRLDLGW